MTPEQIQIMNQQYGLDKPVWMQYLMYLGGMLHGDMGTSFQFSNQPVSYLIATRIRASAQLGIQAMIFGVFFGIILGSIAAINRNTWVDTLVTVLSIIGKSVPNFVLAVLLQYYIALKLGILPIADWGGFSYTILPTIALGVGPLAGTARFIRTGMVDVLNSDYIELARAKGLEQVPNCLSSCASQQFDSAHYLDRTIYCFVDDRFHGYRKHLLDSWYR